MGWTPPMALIWLKSKKIKLKLVHNEILKNNSALLSLLSFLTLYNPNITRNSDNKYFFQGKINENLVLLLYILIMSVKYGQKSTGNTSLLHLSIKTLKSYLYNIYTFNFKYFLCYFMLLLMYKKKLLIIKPQFKIIKCRKFLFYLVPTHS